MGKNVFLDNEVLHLLDENKKILKSKNYQQTYTNAIRLLATQEPIKMRIKEI